MARVTTEDCTTSIPNRFQLVIYACSRARDLTSGSESEVTKNNDKNTVIALREIAEKKNRFSKNLGFNCQCITKISASRGNRH